MRYALVSDVLVVGSVNGRVTLQAPKGKGLGSSPGIFLSTLPSGDLSGKRVGGWVDMRDVALQHILALSIPEAGGERIISTARKPFDQSGMHADPLITCLLDRFVHLARPLRRAE